MSLWGAGLSSTGGVALCLLYTLLSHPLESLREEWNSNARPFLDSPIVYRWPVPERVKQIVTGQPLTAPLRDPRLPRPAVIDQSYMLSAYAAYQNDPL
jgi:hypothetical protein